MSISRIPYNFNTLPLPPYQDHYAVLDTSLLVDDQDQTNEPCAESTPLLIPSESLSKECVQIIKLLEQFSSDCSGNILKTTSDNILNNRTNFSAYEQKKISEKILSLIKSFNDPDDLFISLTLKGFLHSLPSFYLETSYLEKISDLEFIITNLRKKSRLSRVSYYDVFILQILNTHLEKLEMDIKNPAHFAYLYLLNYYLIRKIPQDMDVLKELILAWVKKYSLKEASSIFKIMLENVVMPIIEGLPRTRDNRLKIPKWSYQIFWEWVQAIFTKIENNPDTFEEFTRVFVNSIKQIDLTIFIYNIIRNDPISFTGKLLKYIAIHSASCYPKDHYHFIKILAKKKQYKLAGIILDNITRNGFFTLLLEHNTSTISKRISNIAEHLEPSLQQRIRVKYKEFITIEQT